jgi:hypothetical protein
MSLHMRLMVNDEQIGYLVARRLTPGRPTGDNICPYEWTVNINGETRTNLDGKPVEHRFGDGAWALVARVVDAAGFGPPDEDSL